MNIGELQHLIEIQRPTYSKGAAGGVAAAWTTVLSVWAKIEPVSSRERFLSAQVQGEIDHRLTFMYAEELAAIDVDWRAKYDSRIFYFAGPPRNIKEQNDYYEIVALEGPRRT